MPAFLPFSGRNFDDYQDIPQWRSLNIRLLQTVSRFRTSVVIVPMASSNLEILNEFREELAKKHIEARRFCLTASLVTVYERLEKRGVELSSVEGQRIRPKAAECRRLHLSRKFRKQVNTGEKNPFEVAEKVIEKPGAIV